MPSPACGRGDKRGWMAPALPWTFFGVMILGTGILMGGAWAYEALELRWLLGLGPGGERLARCRGSRWSARAT